MPPYQISKAMIHAKKNNNLLLIDENAPDTPDSFLNDGKGIIVIESNNEIADLININYAISVDADIKVIRTYSDSEMKEITNKLFKWKTEQSYGAYLSFSNIINETLGDIQVSKYSYLTFFTMEYHMEFYLIKTYLVPMYCVQFMRGSFSSIISFMSKLIIILDQHWFFHHNLMT
ncbi:hypothetical protein HQN89_32655 [Paenibacillus frigoriresistens]|uniref:hypothetical protein n=1 Tax=Paenibacillus alginolyticus TaxID=59839 RepID=UPI0015667957|nr:hypothetical protein [Paenibacillus frigoriresistens]NRF95590.1 hypothetical protein [Paenibacillus frigoriresistens]